jgi:hypothetical protein
MGPQRAKSIFAPVASAQATDVARRCGIITQYVALQEAVDCLRPQLGGDRLTTEK